MVPTATGDPHRQRSFWLKDFNYHANGPERFPVMSHTGAMWKGHRVALIILIGIIIVGLAAGHFWPLESKYGGKPLVQWVNERFNALNSSDLNQREDEEKRLASIGSAIVPDLLSVLEIRSGSGVEEKLGP